VDGVRTAERQQATLRETAHRPWPLPSEPWVMAQTWDCLLFAHWPVARERLAALVPPSLTLDTHAGTAYLAVTPFVLTGLRPRGLPPAPRISRFGEINVRTYVTAGGKPGILFFSLDASSLAAVLGARFAYRLPYRLARIAASSTPEGVRYAVRRRLGPPARFAARYRPVGERFTAAPGSLEHFLCERYCLYTADRGGRAYRAEIHHPPWPLQPAAAEVAENTMPPALLRVRGQPALLHYSERQDVLVWRLRRLTRPAAG
jgi:uncharacterized protein